MSAFQAPPHAFGGIDNLTGYETVFEAVSGVPVTYSVTKVGTDDGGVYALYYTVERLQ